MRAEFKEPTPAQFGGSFTVYRGLPYQRGSGLGSVFRNVLRFLLPIGKAVGKEVLRSGIGVAGDVLEGESVKGAMRKRGGQAVRNLANQTGQGKVKTQKGKGLGRPKKRAAAAAPIKGRAPAKKRRQSKQKQLGLYYGASR